MLGLVATFLGMSLVVTFDILGIEISLLKFAVAFCAGVVWSTAAHAIYDKLGGRFD